jgi:hypothetical protein
MPVSNPNPKIVIEHIQIDKEALTGPPGPIGPEGDLGSQGPQGERGFVGPQGIKGDKGDAGAVPAESEIGGALRTAVDGAAARGAIGIVKLAPTPNGFAVRSGTANYSSAYSLSIQSDKVSTWLEILNGAGSGKGAFFGMSGSGVDGDSFDLFNWQGGGIGLNTSPTASNATKYAKLTNQGHWLVSGAIVPQWYTPSTLPSAGLHYGAIVIGYTNAGATIPVYSDGANWRKFSDNTVF